MNRRRALACLCLSVPALPALLLTGRHAVAGNADRPDSRWYEAAALMRGRAEAWGDQPYGAVLVMNGTLVGEGPSRVIKNHDPTAHAEREAIRDAQRKLGTLRLPGSVLYSTSRPCAACERAAAEAQVARMYFGPELNDAGIPSAEGRSQ